MAVLKHWLIYRSVSFDLVTNYSLKYPTNTVELECEISYNDASFQQYPSDPLIVRN